MAVAVAGRKRFRGILLGLRDGKVGIRLADGSERTAGSSGEVWLSASDIAEAKLVLTDALIAAAQHGDAAAASGKAASNMGLGAADGPNKTDERQGWS